MHIYQKQLSERVIFHASRDRRFKSASISLHYFMPYEPKMTAALCLLPAVMKRGCVQYPSLAAIARRLEQLFGSDILHFVRKRGSLLEITFRLEAIEDAYLLSHPPIWKDAIELLKEIVYEPFLLNDSFPDDILEQEKRAMSDSVADIINNKDAYALLRAAELLFPNTIYSTRLKGTVECISALTKEDLLSAYEYWMQNAFLHIYYSGSKSVKEVVSYLSDLPNHHPTTHLALSPYCETVTENDQKLYRESSPDAEQSHVVVCYRLPFECHQNTKPAALSLHNSILGYSPFQNCTKKFGKNQDYVIPVR